MGNRVTLQATEFINRPQCDKSFGFRMYDDYGSAYNNIVDELILDDMKLLEYAFDNADEQMRSMFYDSVQGKGIEINGTWYDWDKIKYLFERES